MHGFHSHPFFPLLFQTYFFLTGICKATSPLVQLKYLGQYLPLRVLHCAYAYHAADIMQ